MSTRKISKKPQKFDRKEANITAIDERANFYLEYLFATVSVFVKPVLDGLVKFAGRSIYRYIDIYIKAC